MPGIYCVKAWLNEGELAVGDDIMLVLVGGDIRPHVVDALQALVGRLKNGMRDGASVRKFSGLR